MDGFAVRAADVADAAPSRPGELKLVGRALIGQRPEATVGSGEAMRIATGAPIPGGRRRDRPDRERRGHRRRARAGVRGAERRSARPAAGRGRHRRRPARSRRASDSARPSSASWRTPGVPHPMVHPRPRVVVLSTGDELVAPTTEPGRSGRSTMRTRTRCSARSARRARRRSWPASFATTWSSCATWSCQLRPPGRRVRLVRWGLGGGARRREGRVLPARRRALLPGRDAARDAARASASSKGSRSSACPGTP